MADTLYLKLDRNVQANGNKICLQDIAQISCSSKSTEHRVKMLKLAAADIIHGPGRYVFSVLDVIEAIQQEFPSLEINNLGESDFIITVEKKRGRTDLVSWVKTGLLCALAFFGAAFSIMAFHNDIGITTLFGQLYQAFTGAESDGFTVLEVSYSVGVGLGILIFFHHFAKRRGISDSTPLEVEMRTYEDEIDTALIESESRREKTSRSG